MSTQAYGKMVLMPLNGKVKGIQFVGANLDLETLSGGNREKDLNVVSQGGKSSKKRRKVVKKKVA